MMFLNQPYRVIWLFSLFILHSSAVLRTYNLTLHSDVRAPDGVSREVYLINGQQPGPLIVADEGDDLEIFVKNELVVDTTIHWHGILQRGTPQMDGVPGVTQYPILPGGNFTYKFSLKDEYGFYWYHSHFRAYYNDALRGPLFIRPSSSRSRPFERLASSSEQLDNMLRAEMDATPVLLNDWTHDLSDTIFARYIDTGAFPSCVDSILANGFGRVECLPEYTLQAGSDLGLGDASSVLAAMPKRMVMDAPSKSSQIMTMSTSMDTNMGMPPVAADMTSMSPDGGVGMAGTQTMADMSPSMPSLSPRGCTMPMMFRPGFNASSLPPETCVNTSSPLLTIPANMTRGWLALNLVNSGAVSTLRVSLDAHSMFVYAADGLYVDMQEVKVLEIAIGQRYSAMIRLDQLPGDYFLRFATYPKGDMQQVLEGQAVVSYRSELNMICAPSMDAIDDPSVTWMLTNGSAKPNISELQPRILSPFERVVPPPGPANQTHAFTINQTGIVTWVVDKAPYTEPNIPIIQGNLSDGWYANTTLHMPSNSTIDIIMRISNDSMDSMGHPMHLHGHKFWVLGSGSGSFPYNSVADASPSLINLRDPPYRDTTDLPPSGWVAIRYITENPGAWIFHCHIQWHLVSGMALVLVEGQDQLPTLTGQSQNVPSDSTVTSASSMSTVNYRYASLTLLLTIIILL